MMEDDVRGRHRLKVYMKYFAIMELEGFIQSS
jgi:hypothetical protein